MFLTEVQLIHYFAYREMSDFVLNKDIIEHGTLVCKKGTVVRISSVHINRDAVMSIPSIEDTCIIDKSVIENYIVDTNFFKYYVSPVGTTGEGFYCFAHDFVHGMPNSILRKVLKYIVRPAVYLVLLGFLLYALFTYCCVENSVLCACGFVYIAAIPYSVWIVTSYPYLFAATIKLRKRSK